MESAQPLLLCLDQLLLRRAAFLSVTGLTPKEFDALYADFQPAYDRHRAGATTTRRDGTPRAASPGPAPTSPATYATACC